MTSGETFGGGVAPAVAGFIAQHHGIQFSFTLLFALDGLVCGTLEFAPVETAPRLPRAPALIAEAP